MEGNRRVLVTFDVDGTLIVSKANGRSKGVHEEAFSYALSQVFGILDASIETIQDAAERLDDMKAKMIEYVNKNEDHISDGLEVLPGVIPLLDALSSSKNIIVGLVTGNLQQIAWAKMEGVGLIKYFSVPYFGGFGSDHIERGELVKIASRRAGQLFPGGFDLHAHVGDTANDIKAAEFGCAVPIGVCTGIFTAEQLKQASSSRAVVILPDLTDKDAFMSLLRPSEG